MSLPGQFDIVLASECVPDHPCFCIRVQTNWSLKRHLPDYLRRGGFSQRTNDRFHRQIRVGPMGALCNFTVYSSFGREVVAYVEVQMLSAYHQRSTDKSQEVCLAGDDNFLKDGDVRRDNRRVVRSIDTVIWLARAYFRRLILGMRGFSMYIGDRFISYRDIQIVDNSETVTISGFEVTYDFRTTSPVTTVRSLAPRIHALARSTGEHTRRFGDEQRTDGPRIWAEVSRTRSVALYAKTDIRVRFECCHRRRSIRAFAVRHPRACGVPGERFGYIEAFSQTFFRAAHQFAALANSILPPDAPVAVSDARTAYEFFSTLGSVVSDDRLRAQILDRIIDRGQVQSRLHYRIVPRLAAGPSPILRESARGIYVLAPEYERVVALARSMPGVRRPSWSMMI